MKQAWGAGGGLAFAPGAASARSRLQASGAEHLQSVADRALAEARARAQLATAADPEPACLAAPA